MLKSVILFWWWNSNSQPPDSYKNKFFDVKSQYQAKQFQFVYIHINTQHDMVQRKQPSLAILKDLLEALWYVHRRIQEKKSYPNIGFSPTINSTATGFLSNPMSCEPSNIHFINQHFSHGPVPLRNWHLKDELVFLTRPEGENWRGFRGNGMSIRSDSRKW